MAYLSKHTGNLPVLGVTAAEDNFDDNLVSASLRDLAVDNVDLRASGDKSFLHFEWYEMNQRRDMVKEFEWIEKRRQRINHYIRVGFMQDLYWPGHVGTAIRNGRS